MVPGVIRDEFDDDILGGKFAIVRDRGFLSLSLNGSNVEGLTIALGILNE